MSANLITSLTLFYAPSKRNSGTRTDKRKLRTLLLLSYSLKMAGFLTITFKSKAPRIVKIVQWLLRERVGTAGPIVRDPRETLILRRLHLSLVEITKWWLNLLRKANLKKVKEDLHVTKWRSPLKRRQSKLRVTTVLLTHPCSSMCDLKLTPETWSIVLTH